MATQTQGYAFNPAGFNPAFDYRTPPRTPGYGTHTTHNYSPRQYVNISTPSKGHTRRATGDGTTYTYTYTTSTPRKDTHYSSPTYHPSAQPQTTSARRTDYVSGSDRRRDSARDMYPGDDREYSRSKHYSSTRSRYHHVPDDGGYYDRSYEYLPRYEQYEQQPPTYSYSTRYHQNSYHATAHADHPYYDQVPIYEARDARPRRSSYTAAKPAQPQPPPQRPSTAKPMPAKATEDDARRAGIPAGYSYKNWDPTEEPILLLGSVFDANSLGKWIYDWTVFYYGPATPMSDEAGELWLLLLALAHKVKRAEDIMPRIRSAAERDMVEDFLESGERLWQRFNKLLKLCENFMWKAAKRESAGDKKVRMGHRSGCEFVDAIFGRDRELDRTTKLMAGMRLWSLRFDANCEEILRNPGK